MTYRLTRTGDSPSPVDLGRFATPDNAHHAAQSDAEGHGKRLGRERANVVFYDPFLQGGTRLRWDYETEAGASFYTINLMPGARP
jgi:hypothetical protein